ncbi:hypothetical protein R6Q59_002324 [Mikania micrantha]|uniref:DUF4378 domain-containing protein n=1 Tax=Mikania micrantha TaxID=192012 RepID=A0A5N6NNH2_9ASTR|nr:hypothetical protein E3N88_19370 [Mikania micrantha]
MAKRSLKQRQNKDRSGCIAGIVSIFDFRHGRVTRRLLSNHSAHMTESATGPSCPTSEVSSLMDSEEMDHQIESTKYMDGGLVQARMKELMEEEMQIDQLEHVSSKSFDDQEIKIDQQNPSKKASQHHDLEDLMNKLIMIHEKRNKGQKPTLFDRSNSLDHKRINSRSEEPIVHRTRNFFRRRSKSHECISFNDNDTPFPSNVTNGFRVHHERSISQFSFTEIKKKLKNVIAKSSRDSGCLEKPVVDGNSGWSSPNRDHFCSERFSRISYAFKQDVSSRLCKSERHLSGVNEIGDMNDRVSNIYTEAKKHLYDLLSKEDEDTELIVESHSRTLGNLLSFPGYNSHIKDLGRRNELIVNETQLNVTDDDHQEPNVSDEVHQTEGVVEILKPLSPEEVEAFDATDLSEEDVLSCSPTVSPSRSLLVSDGKNEEVEITSDDKTSKPSPVSVLEPLFSDDDISPARSVSRSAESSIQPRRIQFKETVTPTENQETCIFGHTNEESVYEYVEAVLLASDLNWNEFEQRWLSSAQILDHSLYDELQIFSSRARHDQLLLFDTTNEILNEVCDCLIAFFPTFSNCKPSTHQLPKGIDLINEVWERIESRINCHHRRSLDQLIKKDFQVSRTWIDLRLETREIAMEIEELMLEDMIDATILSLLYA